MPTEDKQDTIITAQAPFLSVSYLWSIMIKPVYVYEIYGYRLYNSSNIGIVYQTDTKTLDPTLNLYQCYYFHVLF